MATMKASAPRVVLVDARRDGMTSTAIVQPVSGEPEVQVPLEYLQPVHPRSSQEAIVLADPRIGDSRLKGARVRIKMEEDEDLTFQRVSEETGAPGGAFMQAPKYYFVAWESFDA